MAQSEHQEPDLPDFLGSLLHKLSVLNDNHVNLPSLRSYLVHVASGQRLKKEDLESAIGGGFVVNPYLLDNGICIVDFALILTRAAVPRSLIRKLLEDGFMSVEDLVYAQQEDPEKFSAKYLDSYSLVVQRRLRGVFVPVSMEDAAVDRQLTGADVDAWRSQVILVAALQAKQLELERLLHQQRTLLEVSSEDIAALKSTAEGYATVSTVDAKEKGLSARIDTLTKAGVAFIPLNSFFCCCEVRFEVDTFYIVACSGSAEVTDWTAVAVYIAAGPATNPCTWKLHDSCNDTSLAPVRLNADTSTFTVQRVCFARCLHFAASRF